MFSSPFPDVEIPDKAFTTISLAASEKRTWTGSPSWTASAARKRTTASCWARSMPWPVPCPPSDWVRRRGRHALPEHSCFCGGVPRASPRRGRVTTVNSLYTPDELAEQLQDAGATWLFTVSALLPGARKPPPGGIAADRLVVLDGAAGHPSLKDLLAAGAPAPASLRSGGPGGGAAVFVGDDGPAQGVRLSHRNLVANVEQSRGLLRVGREDRLLALLPFFHIYGLTVLLNIALRERACLVTMPRFDLAEFLRMIQDHRCTLPVHRPAGGRGIDQASARGGVRSQLGHTTLSGAAPLDGELGAASRTAALPGAPGIRHDRDEPGVAPDSAGRHGRSGQLGGLHHPEHGMQAGGSGHRRGHRHPADGTSAPGQLLCRGPNVMLGYLNRPEETARRWTRTVSCTPGTSPRSAPTACDHRGPGEGTHQVQGLPDCPRGAGGSPADAPRYRRHGSDWNRRRRRAGGTHGVRRPAAGGGKGNCSMKPR